MGTASVLGAFVVLVTVMSPLHHPLKQLCRPALCKWVPRQLRPVAVAQHVQHPLLDVAVLISAATVTVEFYVAGLAIMAWCGMQQQVTILLAVLGLLGHVVFRVKDLLESPRPADCIKAAPEDLHITVKDYSNDVEDGIPSAHCCGSVMLLYYIIHTAAATQPHVQYAAAAWVLWIAYGRLYLGVHSPVDLVAGAALGCCLLALWQNIEQQYIVWLVSSENLQLQVLLASFVLLRTYPMPSRYTDTINYAVAWLGGWAGVTMAYRQLHPVVNLQETATAGAVFWSGVSGGSGNSPYSAMLGKAHCTQQSHSSQQQMLQEVMVPMTCVKILVGFAAIGITKAATKTLMLLILRYVFSYVPSRIRCLWQPPVPGCSHPVSTTVNIRGRNTSKPGQQLAPCVQASGCDVCGRETCAHSEAVPAGSSNRVLRHAKDGTAHDVVVTARFFSYVAVGYLILTLDVWWHPLVLKLVYTSSMS